VLVTDGHHFFILEHRATITQVNLSSTLPHNFSNRILTHELKVPHEERGNLTALTGGNDYMIVVAKIFTKSMIFKMNLFEQIEGQITIESDAGFLQTLFASPKLKPTFASDGIIFIHWILSNRKDFRVDLLHPRSNNDYKTNHDNFLTKESYLNELIRSFSIERSN
jgi:hypothetical protein